MNADLQARLCGLPGATRFEYARGEWWMDAPDLDVLALAKALSALGARLATMTGAALVEGETAIVYHYVIQRQVLNLKTRTQGNAQLSLTPLLPAANWIEREIHDLFGTEFHGHPRLTRLIRPPEVPVGFFREPGTAPVARPSQEG